MQSPVTDLFVIVPVPCNLFQWGPPVHEYVMHVSYLKVCKIMIQRKRNPVRPQSTLVQSSVVFRDRYTKLDFAGRKFKQRLRLRKRQRHKAGTLLVKKAKIIVLHVQHEFPCISLPYSTKQKLIKPLIFYVPLKPFVSIQLQDSSPVLYKVNKTE